MHVDMLAEEKLPQYNQSNFLAEENFMKLAIS